MTLLTLDNRRISSDEEERTLLLGLEYDSDTDRRLDEEQEVGMERERYDDQILAGLVTPW